MLQDGLSDRFRLSYTDLQLASDGCVDHSQGCCVIVMTAPTTIKVTPSTFVSSGMWSRHLILGLLMSESPTEDRLTIPLNIVQCIEVPGLLSRPFQGFVGVVGLSQ
ncbi:unnamed protein product [Ilex paraguariensis]|uniref:Uncharacterized protein n=1 Tax=Ilex paraguariensis TaxID=185542 RepID=A0ABC8U9F7_9AQUA